MLYGTKNSQPFISGSSSLPEGNFPVLNNSSIDSIEVPCNAIVSLGISSRYIRFTSLLLRAILTEVIVGPTGIEPVIFTV